MCVNLRTCTQALAMGFRLRFGCDETSTATFLKTIIGKSERGFVEEMKQLLETKQARPERDRNIIGD